MKKLLVLGLLCSLTACAAADMTVLQTAPVPLATVAQETLRYEANMVEYRKTAEAENGTKLAQVCWNVPELQVLQADGTPMVEAKNAVEQSALAAAETFNRQFQESDSEENFQALQQQAKGDYAVSPQRFTEGGNYSETLTTSVYRVGELISVRGEYVTDTGGAHPNTVLLGRNFDLSSGTFITVTTLAADVGEFLTSVAEEMELQAQTIAAENGMATDAFFNSDYRETLGGWTSYAVSFNEAGMTVGFSPYELACYSAGPQEFFLPYERLRPWLGDHGLALLGLQEK